MSHWQQNMITGGAGPGKSSCARHLGQFLDLPVYHMDKEVWLPGWLGVPLWLRLLRGRRRNLVNLGQSRPDMADKCTEQLSKIAGFLWFILRTASASRRKKRVFLIKRICPSSGLPLAGTWTMRWRD
jgi:hypothetical protein